MGWHNLSEMGFYDFAQFLTLGLYLVSILLFVTGMLLKKPLLTSKAVTVLFLAFISHLGTTAYGIYIVGGNIIIRSEFFFNLLALTLMCTAFIISWRMKINLPLLAISPLVLLLYIASLTVQSVNLRELGELPALFLGLHVGSLFVSVSLFTLAFGAAIFYLLLERKIKTKEKINSFMQSIPPLLVVDTINNLAITIGFPLYTLGAVSGFFWAYFKWGSFFSWDPKEIITILVWIFTGILFVGRLLYGLRGRKAAWLVIGIFGLSAISLLGINFFLPTHHSFI